MKQAKTTRRALKRAYSPAHRSKAAAAAARLMEREIQACRGAQRSITCEVLGMKECEIQRSASARHSRLV
eukprot:scaffold145213_cov31-Tisochrysis_lutea.AAC.2